MYEFETKRRGTLQVDIAEQTHGDDEVTISTEQGLTVYGDELEVENEGADYIIWLWASADNDIVTHAHVDTEVAVEIRDFLGDDLLKA